MTIFTKYIPMDFNYLQENCDSEGDIKILIGISLKDLQETDNLIRCIFGTKIREYTLEPVGVVNGYKVAIIDIGSAFAENCPENMVIVEMSFNVSCLRLKPNEKVESQTNSDQQYPRLFFREE